MLCSVVLTEYLVQDLNVNPKLPFEDNSFDVMRRYSSPAEEELLPTFLDTAIDAEGMDMEIELSNLGTVNTMFAALFSLEFLLRQPYQPLFLKSLKWNCQSQTPSDRIIKKQCAQLFGVTISYEQAQSGIFVRVTSTAQSKFKDVVAACEIVNCNSVEVSVSDQPLKMNYRMKILCLLHMSTKEHMFGTAFTLSSTTIVDRLSLQLSTASYEGAAQHGT
ncbi:hypothetical protein Tco_1359386 [Tanacetum coccineum]